MNEVSQGKILVVDDEAGMRDLLKLVLGGWGYTVLTAADGCEALSVAEREQPDLILLDIAMPKLNGMEACVQLRERPTTRNIRIIILTAYDTQSRLEESIVSGADDFLGKPINQVELRVRVASMLKVKDIPGDVERLEAYIKHMREMRAELARAPESFN
jgi:CheY-like chemotaxis protein